MRQSHRFEQNIRDPTAETILDDEEGDELDKEDDDNHLHGLDHCEDVRFVLSLVLFVQSCNT